MCTLGEFAYFSKKNKSGQGFSVKVFYSYLNKVAFKHLIQLLESDVFGILSEALTAHVQLVFTDETMFVGASTTVMERKTE